MPYRVHKSVDIDFAHHVTGHLGPCINIHGHTWKFEVELEADALNEDGFVMDFKLLKEELLTPVHTMLDHSLCLWDATFMNPTVCTALASLGTCLVATRGKRLGSNRWWYPARLERGRCHGGEEGQWYIDYEHSRSINGMICVDVNGTKVVIVPFAPTSERLAKWLFDAALATIKTTAPNVRVVRASVYETLHPVESVATYTPMNIEGA